MLETQLAQLAAALPSFEQDKIPRKPKDHVESVKLVTTRLDKPPLNQAMAHSLTLKKDDPGRPNDQVLHQTPPQKFL